MNLDFSYNRVECTENHDIRAISWWYVGPYTIRVPNTHESIVMRLTHVNELSI